MMALTDSSLTFRGSFCLTSSKSVAALVVLSIWEVMRVSLCLPDSSFFFLLFNFVTNNLGQADCVTNNKREASKGMQIWVNNKTF